MRRIFLASVLVLAVLTGPVSANDEGVLHSKNIRSVSLKSATEWIHRATFIGDVVYASYWFNGGGVDVFRTHPNGQLKRLARFPCPGNGEGSITSWRHYIFQAVESPEGANGLVEDVGTTPGPAFCGPADTGGIRVVDVSDPERPRMAGFIELPCGSHGITPFPFRGKLLIYNSNGCSGYSNFGGSSGQGGILNTALFMEVIEFNEAHPSKSEIATKPKIEGMAGCHDVTVYPPRDLAVCTGTERFAMLDVSDPYNPKGYPPVDNLNTGPGSAQFTWDGTHVLMNTIPLRSHVEGESCLETGKTTGGMLIYNVEDPTNPVQVGRIELERPPPMWEQGEGSYKCHASNFTVVPMRDRTRYVAVTTWGRAGLRVIDFSDPAKPLELAFWQPQWANISWWGAWYNGHIYISENSAGEDNEVTSYVAPPSGPGIADVRVLDMDGLGRRETLYFRDGLATQWQDPSNLRR